MVDTPWSIVPPAVVRSRPAAGKILNHHPLAWPRRVRTGASRVFAWGQAEADAWPRGNAPSGEDPSSTGSVQHGSRDAGAKRSAGKDSDDVSLGKNYFNAGKFSLAERHFRRALELHPRDLDSWIGLAASYDRLRRFELADRAYEQAIKIGGATGEILNNRGYSYMLRGDHRRARETLLEAQVQDPGNAYIKNNLELLEASARKTKATQ